MILRWTIRSSLRPVSALTTQAARISTSGTGERLPEPPGRDEFAELARALNAMLDRLHASFERECAFVDDASHELRTPIAVLRGELELALLDNDPAQMRRAVEIARRQRRSTSATSPSTFSSSPGSEQGAWSSNVVPWTCTRRSSSPSAGSGRCSTHHWSWPAIPSPRSSTRPGWTSWW